MPQKTGPPTAFFSNFFHHWKHYWLINKNQSNPYNIFQTHLQHVAALLRKGTSLLQWAHDTVRLLKHSILSCIPPDHGHQTASTSIQSPVGFGTSSSSKYVSCGCIMVAWWNNACCTFGMAWTRASLTMQLRGMGVGKLWTLWVTFVTVSILFTQLYDKNVSFLLNIQFVNCVLICDKFELTTFQSSAATCMHKVWREILWAFCCNLNAVSSTAK